MREPQELVDHEAHVARLVVEVGEVGSTRHAPPGEREVDRGDDEPAAREVRRVVELAAAAVE